MTTQSLFEIAVPVKDNAGAVVPEGRHFAFENECMHRVGGYSKMPDIDGAWRNAEGRIFYDRMRSYRVLTDRDTALHLVSVALRIYQDQEAIFLSEIGRAWIIPRTLSNDQLDRHARLVGALAGEF